MKVNGNAIYATRPVAPYKENNICFTQNKTGEVNAIYLAAETEKTMPATITIKGIRPSPKAVITLLGYSGKLKWKTVDGATVITLPESSGKILPAPMPGRSGSVGSASNILCFTGLSNFQQADHQYFHRSMF
jgi:alpha-L-fucosidase